VDFHATAESGETVEGGDIIGIVEENEVISLRIIVPPAIYPVGSTQLPTGTYAVTDPWERVKDDDGDEHALLHADVAGARARVPTGASCLWTSRL
jgi:V/A-type H+/Na+-transporting ATPase subunit A